MANETEPRALGAALAAPAFVTRAHGVALHAANRHVERWAPEAGANRVRSMRSLGVAAPVPSVCAHRARRARRWLGVVGVSEAVVPGRARLDGGGAPRRRAG